ncbi:MAG: PIN domain-containing protein [Nitrospirales bacterium]|nr:MAG: PIN domain-containing protein [Nitrospirales bacterium]
MRARKRVVLDTNMLVSRLLTPGSVPAQAVHKAIQEADILMSEATVAELADVLNRKKFDDYVSVEDRQKFLRLLIKVVDMVPINTTVSVCRDPKDNMFLELAINGEANIIVTGDDDLLALNPFRNIEIVTPAVFLEMAENQN